MNLGKWGAVFLARNMCRPVICGRGAKLRFPWALTIAWGWDEERARVRYSIPWRHFHTINFVSPINLIWLHDGGRRRLLAIKYWTPRGWYLRSFSH